MLLLLKLWYLQGNKGGESSCGSDNPSIMYNTYKHLWRGVALEWLSKKNSLEKMRVCMHAFAVVRQAIAKKIDFHT